MIRKNYIMLAFLVALTAIALLFCYILVAPFLKPIVFAAILAIIFHPVQARLRRWIGNRNAAAALSTIAVILFVSLATIFLGRAILSGLGDIYQSLGMPGGSKERLGVYVVHILKLVVGFAGRYVPISVADLQVAISNQAEKIISSLLAMSAGALGSIAALLGNALISFFVLFFLFRDGRSALRRVAAVLPLRRDQVKRLYVCVKETLNAIVYGTLAIATIQGTLTGVAFAFLGLTSPVLWAIVTSLCALLPVIGTAFVFLPAMSMLAFNGQWIKGVILLIWAVAIVHPIDNVLRPYLIGGRTKLSTLYVFFALLGGLKTFGALGVFIGPLILALTVALFKFLREERRDAGWKLVEQSSTRTEREGAAVGT
jgi:predicted PurR-regulated permease PerM